MAPSLLESLEILFTAHCCENSPKVQSAFVVDLYAEASRNPQVANLVRGVLNTAMEGLTKQGQAFRNRGSRVFPTFKLQ